MRRQVNNGAEPVRQKYHQSRLLHRASGFTLMELMVALAILSFLSVLAAPSYDRVIKNSRMASATSDLMSSLATAKSESIGRNNAISLCKRNSDASACVTSGGWQQGWIIFIDDNNNGVLNSGEEVLYSQEAYSGDLTIYGTSAVADRVTYRASGLTHFTTMQTFVFCDDRGYGDDARGVMVSVIGRGASLKVAETGETTCLVPA